MCTWRPRKKINNSKNKNYYRNLCCDWLLEWKLLDMGFAISFPWSQEEISWKWGCVYLALLSRSSCALSIQPKIPKFSKRGQTGANFPWERMQKIRKSLYLRKTNHSNRNIRKFQMKRKFPGKITVSKIWVYLRRFYSFGRFIYKFAVFALFGPCGL